VIAVMARFPFTVIVYGGAMFRNSSAFSVFEICRAWDFNPEQNVIVVLE